VGPDALSKTVRRRIWWSRQPRIDVSDITRTVAARFHECRFPLGECSYNAVLAASDGAIYFSIGSHRPDVAARILRFDPARHHVESLCDVAEQRDRPAIAHGKIHVPFAEMDGRIYMATHVGHYRRERGIERPASWPGLEPYPGGRLLSFALSTGRLHDIARAPDGEGVLALALDCDRRRLHAVTWPGGLLVSAHADTGAIDNHGPVFGRGELGGPGRGRWEPVGRDLALDPRDGRVYWSRSNGEIGVLDPDGARRTLPLRLRMDGRPAAWRRIVWHPREQVFVGLTVPGGVVFRFDPKGPRVEALAALTPHRPHRWPARPPVPTLAFELDAARDEVCALVLGPGLSAAGRRTRHTLEFVTANLRDGRVSHHGVVRLDDGRHPTFAQGLASSGGRFYAPAWIELPAGDPSPRIQALRAIHAGRADAQIHGEVEEVGLISFDDPRGPAR
jgi:hypothetical protein